MKHSKQLTRRATAANEAGMTLIELVIASGIVMGGLVLMMGSIMSISQTTTQSAERAQASIQMVSLAEFYQDMTLDEMLTFKPPMLDGLGVTQSVEVDCMGSNGEYLSLPMDSMVDSERATLPNPLEVRIAVEWRDSSGRRYSKTVATTVGR